MLPDKLYQKTATVSVIYHSDGVSQKHMETGRQFRHVFLSLLQLQISLKLKPQENCSACVIAKVFNHEEKNSTVGFDKETDVYVLNNS